LLGLELGEPPGLEGFLGAPPGVVAVLESLLALPLAPDELELPGEEVAPLEVAPPDADLLPSRSHPAIREPLRANTSAAANAVNFMLTSMGCVPSELEQVMDRESAFTKVVLFTDRDGRAKFREERVALTEGTPQARLSALLPASACQLRESPPGFRSEFHCTPKAQWVFILRGEMEIGLQDGTSRRFAAGEHFFAADVLPEGARFDPKVHGHWSAQRGKAPLVTLFLKV
jgi:hypothetical protein